MDLQAWLWSLKKFLHLTKKGWILLHFSSPLSDKNGAGVGVWAVICPENKSEDVCGSDLIYSQIINLKTKKKHEEETAKKLQ